MSIKFPYVTEYKLGEGQVEIKDAEELLAEYQDFYLYNQSQYNEIFKNAPLAEGEERNDGEEDDEKLIELQKLRAEQNAKSAVEHWGKLFGSMDFAESALIGLRINWGELQAILIEEFKARTHPTDSSMNYIAPPLRKLCSILLIAHKLHERGAEPCEKINHRLDQLSRGELLGITIPEYHKVKKQLTKCKTPDALQKFVEENF